MMFISILIYHFTFILVFDTTFLSLFILLLYSNPEASSKSNLNPPGRSSALRVQSGTTGLQTLFSDSDLDLGLNPKKNSEK